METNQLPRADKIFFNYFYPPLIAFMWELGAIIDKLSAPCVLKNSNSILGILVSLSKLSRGQLVDSEKMANGERRE